MTTVSLCIGVAVLAFGFGVAGLYLQKLLPEPHSVERSRDMIGAIVGLVSLLLALVLGTLIGSAYAFYSTQKSEIETFAAREVQLDLALAEFGPETKEARLRMKEALQAVRQMVWGDSMGANAAPDLSVGAPLGHLRELDEYVASLDPKTPAQRQFAAAAARQLRRDRANACAHIDAIGQFDLLASGGRRGVVGADPFLRVRSALSAQRHDARRAGLRRIRSRQRAIPHCRIEPTLHRGVPGALRRIRPDAGLDRQMTSRRVALDVDRQPARAPRAGLGGEHARHPRPAAPARSFGVERVARDRVAVARDRARAAGRAERRLARRIVDIADIDVMKPVLDRDRSRPLQRRRRRRRDLQHVIVGMEGGEMQRRPALSSFATHRVSASISSSESFSPGMRSVVISVHTPVSCTRYLSVSSTGASAPAQRLA